MVDAPSSCQMMGELICAPNKKVSSKTFCGARLYVQGKSRCIGGIGDRIDRQTRLA
jgi:hypothetical protein